MQWWSDPDLCIEVSAGASVAKTTTKKNTVDPTWDETLLLWPELPRLTVRVYDVDAFSMQDLGCATIDLGAAWADTSAREERVRPLPLTIPFGSLSGPFRVTAPLPPLSGQTDLGDSNLVVI